MGFFLAVLLWGGTADRVVAVVGAEPILQSDVEFMVHLAMLENPYLDVPQDSLRAEVLDRLIEQKLVFKKGAQDTTIIVDREEIMRSADRQLDVFFAQLDSFPEEAAQLEEWGLTRSRLRAVLSAQLRSQSIVQQILARQGKSQPYVSPNEVREFYEKNKDSVAVIPGYISMSHIALGITPSQAEQARLERKVAEVLDILGRGGDFDVVASSFSEDYTTRSNGGSLGWVKKGELSPELDAALFSLPLGGPSQPVLSREGFHLFYIEKRSADRVYARHILFRIRITRSDTLRVMELADEIKKDIEAGEMSFSDAAEAYSEDFSTSEQGGYIGDFPFDALTELPRPFDSVALAIDSGQVSEPFASEMGVHLLYANDKKDEKILSFEEMQIGIRNYLVTLKQEEWLKDIITEAKEEFYVEKKL